MNKSEQQTEALQRAKSQSSFANYQAIIQGLIEKGIPADEIRPRENVFTFNAWRALNRTVKKGEKGVQIVSWIPCEDKTTGEKTMRPKTAYVFHISQTNPLGE
jgi:hypothetical protein